MKRSLPSAFAFMLSIGVSSLAMGEPTLLDSSALTTPPAPKTRYVPSVPARDNNAAATGAPAQHYVPSVPARVVTDTPAPVLATAPLNAAPAPHYAPSVPARIVEQAPTAPTAAPHADPESMTTAVPVETPVENPPHIFTSSAPVATAPATESAPAPILSAAPVEETPAPATTIVAHAPTPLVATQVEAAPAPEAAPTKAHEPVASPTAQTTPPVPALAETKTGQDYIPPTPVRPMPEKAENAPLAVIGKGPADPGLSDALAKAYNFNPELQSFRSRAKSVDEQIPQAYSGWLPNARADYSYGYDKQKLDNRVYNGTHPETKDISVTQPLFNGGETVARTSRAFNSVTLARAQLTDAEQRILGDSVKAYMDVVRTGEILKLSINNEQVLKEQLQATRDRFKLGETTHTDVAQSESRLARATSDRVRAEGDLDVAKAAYLRNIGEAPPAHASLKMPEKLPPIPKSLEEALDIGLKKNPGLISASVNREIADNDVDIAVASILPDISLRGTKSKSDDLNLAKGVNSDESTFTLNASIPLYQGGAEYSRVRQNKRVRQQRKEEAESTRDETVQNITSRWRDITTSRASIVSNKSAVDSATVALNGVRQEADVGTRTTLDVLDAEQELFLAKVNLVTAQSQEVIAVYNLLATCGILTAPDLGLNVEPYNPKIHERSVKYRVIGF